MSFKLIATIAAVDSLAFGVAGLLFPAQLASALVGELDPIALAIVRLAAAAYIGYGLLAWLVRDVQDRTIMRAIELPNAIAWGLSAVVFATALISGLGPVTLWVIVAMQLGFAGAWLTPLVRERDALASTS